MVSGIISNCRQQLVCSPGPSCLIFWQPFIASSVPLHLFLLHPATDCPGMGSVLQETWRMALWRLPLPNPPPGPWKAQKAHRAHSCIGMHGTGPVHVSKWCSPTWPLGSMGIDICFSCRRADAVGKLCISLVVCIHLIQPAHFSSVSCPQRQPPLFL